MRATLDPNTGRLTCETVRALEAALPKDQDLRDQIDAHLWERWGARNLFALPQRVAQSIISHPGLFLCGFVAHLKRAT